MIVRSIEFPVLQSSNQGLFEHVEALLVDDVVSHAVNQLGEKNVKFIVETIRSKEEAVPVPIERISQSSKLRIITEFIQMVIHETDV